MIPETRPSCVRRAAVHALLAAGMMVWSTLAHGAEAVEKLTGGDNLVVMPSILRVVFGFLLVSGLAVGAVWVLKRHLPRFGPALGVASHMQVVEKMALAPGTRAYLLQVSGSKVLVVESRAGLSATALPPATDGAIT